MELETAKIVNIYLNILVTIIYIITLSNISSGKQLTNDIISSGLYGGSYMISETSDLSQLQYAVDTCTSACKYECDGIKLIINHYT